MAFIASGGSKIVKSERKNTLKMERQNWQFAENSVATGKMQFLQSLGQKLQESNLLSIF